MPIVFRRNSFFTAGLVAGLAVAFLCGCLVKDKSDKALSSGGMTPPWDPAKFMPKSLEGFVFPASDSVFGVFGEIGRLDSMGGEPKTWKPIPGAVDTLRVSQMFDTGFVFPQNPESVMPYGYDDSFRDDTLYRTFYGNGLFTQDHPCAATYILSGQFLHPARWVKTGMKQDDIIAALGNPLYRQNGVLRYLSHHPFHAPPTGEADSSSTAREYIGYEVFEGVNFYFHGDSLFAAVLQKSRPCH